MGVIKEFLVKETIHFLDFEISTFILTAFLIFIALNIVLKIKKKPILENIIKTAFITLTIIAFLFAFLNSLTGEFLFSQQENIKTYMFIATIALFLYIIDMLKEIEVGSKE